MAEPKKKKIVDADSGKEVKAGSRKKKAAAPVGNATGFRVGAIALWVVALAFEVLAYLVLIGKINLNFMPTLWQMIAFLVLDLICVIVGSQFWKKANHIKPASEKNKTLFWLWNNMGLIVAVVCFFPFVILALTNKEADKKTKVIAAVVAVIAMLIGGACSIDYNPVSAEEQQAAMEAISDDVYWSPFGKVYHTHDDCSSLNQSDTLTYGTVEQAIAENRTRLCSYCAKRDEITGVTTDGKDVSDVEFEEVEEEVEEELEVEEDIDAEDVDAEEDIEEAEE